MIFSQSTRDVIPCKPSNPLIKMSLDYEGIEVNVSSSSGWSYDPREGFIINRVQADTAGFYDCKARSAAASKEQTTNFIVTVQGTHKSLKYISIF